jgi:hypothetical protein
MKVLSIFNAQDPMLKIIAEKYRRMASELTHPRILTLEEQTEINRVPKWIYQIEGFENFIFTDPVQREYVFEMLKDHVARLKERKESKVRDYIGDPDWFPEANSFFRAAGQMLCGIESKEVLLRYYDAFDCSFSHFADPILMNRHLYPISSQEFGEAIVQATAGFGNKSDIWLQLEGFTPEYPNRLHVPDDLREKLVNNLSSSPMLHYIQMSVENIMELDSCRKRVGSTSPLHTMLPDMILALRNLPDDELRKINSICGKNRVAMMKTILEFDTLSEDEQMALALTYDLIEVPAHDDY